MNNRSPLLLNQSNKYWLRIKTKDAKELPRNKYWRVFQSRFRDYDRKLRY